MNNRGRFKVWRGRPAPAGAEQDRLGFKQNFHEKEPRPWDSSTSGTLAPTSFCGGRTGALTNGLRSTAAIRKEKSRTSGSPTMRTGRRLPESSAEAAREHKRTSKPQTSAP